MNASTFPTLIISLALVFYSIGVWSERISGRLKKWHLLFFVLGLICDTWGTGLMIEMAGGLTFDIHGITGVIAILLMFIHGLWAFFVLLRKDEKAIRSFHKFSITVWMIWLIPYLSPMVFALTK
ncbi:MAG: HsmA family protein [Chloroflexi bacterium]|nr:HsmA family protein [Chloroflexota bacterium]